MANEGKADIGSFAAKLSQKGATGPEVPFWAVRAKGLRAEYTLLGERAEPAESLCLSSPSHKESVPGPRRLLALVDCVWIPAKLNSIPDGSRTSFRAEGELRHRRSAGDRKSRDWMDHSPLINPPIRGD
jgi:hypothetical protein